MCPRCTASQPAQDDGAFGQGVIIEQESKAGLAPILDTVNDRFQEVCRPAPLSRRRPIACPGCDSTADPKRKTEVAALGWIVFLVLFLFIMWPLCWLGLFFKETWEVCQECGWRLRKVDGPTFTNPGLAVCLIFLVFFVVVITGVLTVVLVALVKGEKVLDMAIEILRLSKQASNP